MKKFRLSLGAYAFILCFMASFLSGCMTTQAIANDFMDAPVFQKQFWSNFFKKNEMMRDRVMVKNKDGEEFYFYVEMAVTKGQQENGLMDREVLPEEEGMLFVFDSVRKRTFWMKDTLLPLDMLFLDMDGKINHIHHNAKPQDRTLITSQWPVKAVLEINGGLSERLGIHEADVVYHPVFRNVLAQE